MAKKKKKQKKSKPSPESTEVKDLGAQEIIRIEDKLYRLPDYKELKMGLKHIYGVYNTNLQKYYARNLLCPQDHKVNTLRFLVVNDIPVGRGKKFQNLIEALDYLRDHFKMS